MKNKILQEFLNSDIKIISQEKLNQYIDYCIDNNEHKKIKYITSHHHILPNKLFEEFSNLKNNQWNGTHLIHAKHYKAHWLLTEAIDNYSMLFAFVNMHRTDTKNGRITENDLIPEYDYQTKMEKSIRDLWDNPINRAKMLNSRKKTSDLPESKIKKSQILKKRHSDPEFKKKFKATMSKVNKQEDKRLKAGAKLKEKWKDDDYRNKTIKSRLRSYVIVDLDFNVVEKFDSRGDVDKTGLKVQKFLDTWEEIYMKNISKQKYNGLLLLRNETYLHYIETNEKLYKKKRVFKKKEPKITLILKSIYYDGELSRISTKVARNIYNNLIKTSKEKYLGYTHLQKTRMTNANNNLLIGLYVEKIN